MQRLKGLGQRAFSEFDATGMHQRIIWRFLDGVRDRDIRSAIIEQRWMKDRKTPKPYEEILKIAENARMLKVAANATGGATGSGKTKERGTLGAAKGQPPSHGQTPRGRGRSGRGRGNGAQRPLGECYYCHEKHDGGWYTCAKRLKENPNWSPGYDTRTRSHTPSDDSSSSDCRRPPPPPSGTHKPPGTRPF